jgi:hypothetical protein
LKFITALLLASSMALAASPAIALPPQASDKAAQGQEHKPATPGPSATAESKRKAYGSFCQDQSKKKAEGQDKSDFAKCVTAMAKAANDDSVTAREACKSLPKKHTKGEKGTPFSRCRVGVAQLRKEQEGS